MPIISPSPVFRWFVPAQSGSGLVPAAGYKAKWYSAGTTNAKAIYDASGVVYPSPSNTAVLNSEGYAPIRLGDGMYKLVVTDSLDNPVYTQDNIQGGGSFSTGIVATVANDLPGVDTGTYPFVYCMGYYAIGDGGHGFFYNATSGTAPDGGYVVASTFDGTKRWFRLQDESGDVRAASFGYIGTKSGNLSTQLTNACAYAFSNSKRLLIGPGNVAKVGTSGLPFQLYTWDIHFEPGSMLTADTGVTTLNIPVAYRITGSSETHFTGFTSFSFASDLLEMPDPTFWGATTSADNTTAFARWIAAGTGNCSFVLPPGNWPYANPLTFPYPTKPLLLWGTIGSGGNAIPPGVYFPDGSRFRFGTWKLKDGQTITSSSGSYVEVSSGLRAAADLIAGTSVNAGTSVGAATFIAAGTTSYAGQYFFFNAGTSSRTAKVGGRYGTLLSQTGSSTSTTAKTTLMSLPIDANTMTASGDRMVLKAAGILSSAAHVDFLFEVDLGSGFGIKIADLPLYLSQASGTFYATFWSLEAEVFYMDATHSMIKASVQANHANAAGSGAFISNTYYQYLAHTSYPWTSAQYIAVAATAPTSGTVTQNLLTLDFYPAP